MAEHLKAMLDSQPHHPSALEVIRRCVAACLDCGAACTTCAIIPEFLSWTSSLIYWIGILSIGTICLDCSGSGNRYVYCHVDNPATATACSAL